MNHYRCHVNGFPDRMSMCALQEKTTPERDKNSTDRRKVLAYWRHRYASPTSPQIFNKSDVRRDPDGDSVMKEVEMPEVLIRQAWNAQDPLASNYKFQ